MPIPGEHYLVHPAPLYDMAFNLLWFGILLALRDHKWMQNGNLLKTGIAGYAFFRFFGQADVRPALSLLIVATFLASLSAASLRLLHTGYKLRH